MSQQLTHKQQLFVSYYIQTGGNGALAARLAGYTGNEATLKQMASQNLTKPYLKAAINSQREELHKTISATTEHKRNLLWKMALRNAQPIEREEIEETVDEEGNTVIVKTTTVGMYDSRAATAQIAELNRMDGDHAAPKTEGPHQMTIEETLELLAERKKSAEQHEKEERAKRAARKMLTDENGRPSNR